MRLVLDPADQMNPNEKLPSAGEDSTNEPLDRGGLCPCQLCELLVCLAGATAATLALLQEPWQPSGCLGFFGLENYPQEHPI